MSTLERYHAPLRRDFQVIDRVAPPTPEERADPNILHRSFDSILQMAVKSVSGAVGPEGLMPTLLVHGEMPRHGVEAEPPHPTNIERA